MWGLYNIYKYTICAYIYIYIYIIRTFLLNKVLLNGKLLHWQNSRSCHRRWSVGKGVLRNFAKFTGKHLSQRPANLLKKRLWHRYVRVNFAKFVRTTFLQSTSERLVLHWQNSEVLHELNSVNWRIHCLKNEISC